MAKPKTRVVISVNDVPRELFSISESVGGDLTLLEKKSDQLGETLGPFTGLTELRYTAHNSPKSSLGNSFIQHISQSDGTSIDNACFVLRRENELIWMLYGSRCSSREYERYISTPKAKDVTISLGSYNPRFGTLIYFVIITSKDLDRSDFSFQQCSVAWIDFSKFSVGIVYTFLMAPSLNQGQVGFNVTSQPAFDGNKSAGRISEGSPSKTKIDLGLDIGGRIAQFSIGHVLQFVEKCRRENFYLSEKTREDFAILCELHLPVPFEQMEKFDSKIAGAFSRFFPREDDADR